MAFRSQLLEDSRVGPAAAGNLARGAAPSAAAGSAPTMAGAYQDCFVSGFANQYRVQAADALKRRVLEELFLEAASRLHQVRREAIGNKQLGRANFALHAHMQMWTAFDAALNLDYPSDFHQVPGSFVPIKVEESTADLTIDWTVEAKADSQSSSMLLAWPVFNSEAVWAGQDMAVKGGLLATQILSPMDPTKTQAGVAFTQNDVVTLGSSVVQRGLNAHGLVGVLLTGVGAWELLKCHLLVREVAR